MNRPKALAAVFLPLCLAVSTAHAAPVAGRSPACLAGQSCERLIYIGSHTGGPGQGISAARFDERTGQLTGLGIAAEIERPTWLTPSKDRPVVYSVSETGNDGKSQASVYALAVDARTGKLSTLNHVPSGGGGATHLDLDPRSHTLFVANFGTGQVSALPIRSDGGLEPPASVVQDFGTGPHRRQTSPHAHAVALDPSGRFLLVADLGADRTFVYRFDPKTRALSAATPPFAAAPPGSGPRHVAFLPNGRFVFVNSELTGDLTTYRWEAGKGRMTSLKTISTLAPSYTGEKSAAELATSKDGRFLYISNRGEDTITAYAANGSTGDLTEVQRIACGGKTPWSFTIDPTGRWMLVANEASSTINVFRLDPKTGRLAATDQSLSTPKPVSVAFSVG